jgi:hypothetical protein
MSLCARPLHGGAETWARRIVNLDDIGDGPRLPIFDTMRMSHQCAQAGRGGRMRAYSRRRLLQAPHE